MRLALLQEAAALLRPGHHPGQVADDPFAEGGLGEGVEESGGEGQLLLGCFVRISE
ncbi:hypothetical protein ACFW96_13480 [Streptomyces gardneri]|uniref:hypothetical protein n=1 Tax=Streptomyces gardneri TaxID=66892 RepID=UPI0036AB63D4